MDNPGIKNLGEKNPITAAVSGDVITSASDSTGVTQAYVDRLSDMGSATFFVDFEYGSGGTTAIVVIDTSLDQGDNWIEIARFDFATADRIAALTVSGAAPADVSSLAALGAEGKRDGFLGDRLRARLVTTGTYAGNTSVKVRAFVRGAGSGDASVLAALSGVATQTTLAALLAKVIAAPSTEAKQDATNALLTAIGLSVDGLETALGSPMQNSGGSVGIAAGTALIGKVGLVPSGYTATATFTPAAAAYLANDIMDVAKTFTWVDKDGATFPGGELIITSAELVISESAIQSGETSYTLQKFSAARATPLADNDASLVVVADAAIYQHRTDLGSPADRGTILSVKTNGINEQITVPATGITKGELVTNGAFTATATARKVTLHAMAP